MNIVRLPYRNPDGMITEEEFINADGMVELVHAAPDVDTDRLRAFAFALWKQGGLDDAHYLELIQEADRRDGRKLL